MTIRQPSVLPAHHYRRPIKVETGGVRAHTHLAIVADEQGVDARAFVKHFPVLSSPKGLFNEWFGYTLMSCFGIAQPPAAIMPAPTVDGQLVAWAFISFQPIPVSQGTPKEIYDLPDACQAAALIDRLLACHGTPSTIAADELILNGDRNLGNLVFTGQKSFVVIDHGDILGGPAWDINNLLLPTKWMVNKLLDVCTKNNPLSRHTSSAVCDSADAICQALWENYADLYIALDCKNQWETKVALDAVWWRSLELAKWFKDQLQFLV
jgi:hypothetical protein